MRLKYRRSITHVINCKMYISKYCGNKFWNDLRVVVVREGGGGRND